MVVPMVTEERLRIGELSRRTGVSPELLRAWERRYGLLHPERSAGGLRLYTREDLERVRLMRRHLSAGLAAAEAARLSTQAPLAPASGGATLFDPLAAREELGAALERFDEPAAQAVFDQVLARTTLDTLLADVVLPYLRDLGDRWQRGDVSIAQEHHASGVLRQRLLSLARGWGAGGGPQALLACPPGERHDIGLIAFGLALRARGWRIHFIGADTPIESLSDAARSLNADLVVLATTMPHSLDDAAGQLEALSREHQVAIGGPGAHPLTAAPHVHILENGAVVDAETAAAL
jgi:MerR family transcriptional regulator, light-induced transcriptional regulator